MIRVVGVRFKPVGKVYYFDPIDYQVDVGARVVVETARGLEYGDVCIGVREVDDSQVVQPLKPVLRLGTERDWQQALDNKQRERDAFSLCLEKIVQHQLEMNLVDAEYTFDAAKAVFYFTSEGRVDFRELVKDLAGALRCRIEMRQIGVRDEAKLIGGIGPCGRILCCTSFLSEFQPVSIRMAKDQNLSLNPTKISGVCGRLMCCLRYEQDQYEDAKKDPTLAPGYVPPIVYTSPEAATAVEEELAGGLLPNGGGAPPPFRPGPPSGSSAPGRTHGSERRSEPRPQIRAQGEQRTGPAPVQGEPGQEGRREGRRRNKRRGGGGGGGQSGQVTPSRPDEAPRPGGGQRPGGPERRPGTSPQQPQHQPPSRPDPNKVAGPRRPGQGVDPPQSGGRPRTGPTQGQDRRPNQGPGGSPRGGDSVGPAGHRGDASSQPGPGNLGEPGSDGQTADGAQRRSRRRPRRRGGRRKDQPPEPPSV